MNADNEIITQTENWVKQVIVKYNICPFARQEVERGSIRYTVVEQTEVADVLLELIKECQYLDQNQHTETTLFILPDGFAPFDDFLDLVDLANDLLFEQGFEGVYQLATFHPDYCFAGEPQSDPANYTNRSPYPCLHLIREASMARVLDMHPDPDAIPQRNIEFCRKKGEAFFVNLLAACLKNG
ncbi:DUF1415 domain-containing protein [Psychromonas antarctica]|uniref:DUF1415 domain-containing protein n=1 Tax=Psychromonas antarctica TaxID=67573 RepID=UPI001EE7FB38|nr:DUF1415 domain-containing protein [Psychromonas antarctica]MCG6200888.1 DUF1415 domain-containing protein [Psychromonas antarctica]